MPSNEHSPLARLTGRLGGSRRILAALTVVALLAVAGTTYGYSALTTSVAVSVDGETREVTSFGNTVGEVLAAEGIEVQDRDIVAPAMT